MRSGESSHAQVAGKRVHADHEMSIPSSAAMQPLSSAPRQRRHDGQAEDAEEKYSALKSRAKRASRRPASTIQEDAADEGRRWWSFPALSMTPRVR